VTLDAETTRAWAKALFARSILKQKKWKALEAAAGDPRGKRCLDLGADNGVVSLLFREKGGAWRSADLDPAAVRSIRSLVGDPVDLLEGASLPYPNASFDLVVVIDLLEHVHDDVRLAAELARVTAPGGRLVACVPHDRPRSMLRKLRLALGLTDEKHGHVRPGYDRRTLTRLLNGSFERFEVDGAVGPASELLDILLSWALERKKGGPASAKGAMITREEGATLGGAGRAYDAIYPLLKAWSYLDHLVPFASSALLVLRAERRAEA
jgi:SAM-dependent methyltransferase